MSFVHTRSNSGILSASGLSVPDCENGFFTREGAMRSGLLLTACLVLIGFLSAASGADLSFDPSTPVTLTKTFGDSTDPAIWINLKAAFEGNYPASKRLIVNVSHDESQYGRFEVGQAGCTYLYNGKSCLVKITLVAKSVGTYTDHVYANYQICDEDPVVFCSPKEQISLPLTGTVLEKPAQSAPSEPPVNFPPMEIKFLPMKHDHFQAKPGSAPDVQFVEFKPSFIGKYSLQATLIAQAKSEHFTVEPMGYPYLMTSGMTLLSDQLIQIKVTFAPKSEGTFTEDVVLKYKLCATWTKFPQCSTEKTVVQHLVGRTSLIIPKQLFRKKPDLPPVIVPQSK